VPFRFSTLLTGALSKATKCFPTHRYHRHASMIYEGPEADEIHSHSKHVNASVLTRLLRYRFGFGPVGETAVTALRKAYNTEKRPWTSSRNRSTLSSLQKQLVDRTRGARDACLDSAHHDAYDRQSTAHDKCSDTHKKVENLLNDAFRGSR
jgi:hypothetical protein